MRKEMADSGDETVHAAKIRVLSDRLVETFGARTCDVAESQLGGAVSADARATWEAIWDYLCGPEAPEQDRIAQLPIE